jgi:lipopolysaccharide/colanic/teichoic acid biosynthesis glycosyltransferase
MIFKQTRIGKHGKPFTMYKFKTMENGVVTRPFLRRTGLDELPQIINIIKGDMALFGPRPERPELDRLYVESIPEWSLRRQVKPGVLGLAQVRGVVRGRDRLCLERKREQAILDAAMIQAGIGMKFHIITQLPSAIRRGQEAS